MKIRSEIISASKAIRNIANRLNANPIYVWDVAEEEFNIIKGCGCIIDQKQINTIATIVGIGLE